MSDGIDFTPMTAAAGSQAPSTDGITFTPAGGSTGNAPAAPVSSSGGNLFTKAVGLINNNPVATGIRSIGAMPFQAAARALGQPDPFSHGIGTSAAPKVNVTTSDQPFGQYAEKQAGNALTVGSMFVPAGAAADAVTGGAGLLGSAARVGANAVLGATQGAGAAMQGGGNASTVRSSALGGALFSGGLAAAGELGGALVENFAGNSATSRLTAQKDRLKTLQNAFADSKTDPIETITKLPNAKLSVIDGKVSTEAVETELENMQTDVNNSAKTLVKTMPGKIGIDYFKNEVMEAIKKNPQIRDSGNVQKALAEIERRFNDYTASFGKDLNYGQINGIRVAMNRRYDADTWDVERAIGNTARSFLYDADNTGGKELQTLMTQSGQLSDAQNFATKLRGTAVKGGRLGKYFADTVGAGVGGAVGSSLGPFGLAGGSALGALAADKTLSAYQRSYFDPMLARPAGAVARTTNSPAARNIARFGKSFLIGDLFGPSSSNSTTPTR